MQESGAAWLEGGCACGEVRYRVAADPILVNNCYCTLCQRQTGSTSVINLFIETEKLELLAGETSSHVVKAGSGGPHEIVRCATCGTALWSFYPRLGRLGAGVRVTTLDESARIRPDAAIFTANRMPWVTLPADVPQFEGAYDPAAILPPSRLARMRALAERKRAASV